MPYLEERHKERRRALHKRLHQNAKLAGKTQYKTSSYEEDQEFAIQHQFQLLYAEEMAARAGMVPSIAAKLPDPNGNMKYLQQRHEERVAERERLRIAQKNEAFLNSPGAQFWKRIREREAYEKAKFNAARRAYAREREALAHLAPLHPDFNRPDPLVAEYLQEIADKDKAERMVAFGQAIHDAAHEVFPYRLPLRADFEPTTPVDRPIRERLTPGARQASHVTTGILQPTLTPPTVADSSNSQVMAPKVIMEGKVPPMLVARAGIYGDLKSKAYDTWTNITSLNIDSVTPEFTIVASYGSGPPEVPKPSYLSEWMDKHTVFGGGFNYKLWIKGGAGTTASFAIVTIRYDDIPDTGVITRSLMEKVGYELINAEGVSDATFTAYWHSRAEQYYERGTPFTWRNVVVLYSKVTGPLTTADATNFVRLEVSMRPADDFIAVNPTTPGTSYLDDSHANYITQTSNNSNAVRVYVDQTFLEIFDTKFIGTDGCRTGFNKQKHPDPDSTNYVVIRGWPQYTLVDTGIDLARMYQQYRKTGTLSTDQFAEDKITNIIVGYAQDSDEVIPSSTSWQCAFPATRFTDKDGNHRVTLLFGRYVGSQIYDMKPSRNGTMDFRLECAPEDPNFETEVFEYKGVEFNEYDWDDDTVTITTTIDPVLGHGDTLRTLHLEGGAWIWSKGVTPGSEDPDPHTVQYPCPGLHENKITSANFSNVFYESAVSGQPYPNMHQVRFGASDVGLPGVQQSIADLRVPTVDYPVQFKKALRKIRETIPTDARLDLTFTDTKFDSLAFIIAIAKEPSLDPWTRTPYPYTSFAGRIEDLVCTHAGLGPIAATVSRDVSQQFVDRITRVSTLTRPAYQASAALIAELVAAGVGGIGHAAGNYFGQRRQQKWYMERNNNTFGHLEDLERLKAELGLKNQSALLGLSNQFYMDNWARKNVMSSPGAQGVAPSSDPTNVDTYKNPKTTSTVGTDPIVPTSDIGTDARDQDPDPTKNTGFLDIPSIPEPSGIETTGTQTVQTATDNASTRADSTMPAPTGVSLTSVGTQMPSGSRIAFSPSIADLPGLIPNSTPPTSGRTGLGHPGRPATHGFSIAPFGT
jgi:hypothetical protein